MWLNQQWQSNSLQLFCCFVFCSYVFLFLFLFVCVFIFCMCVNLLLTLSWFLECHSDHQLDCLHQFIFVCSQCFSVCYTDQCASSMCSLAGKGLNYSIWQQSGQHFLMDSVYQLSEGLLEFEAVLYYLVPSASFFPPVTVPWNPQ